MVNVFDGARQPIGAGVKNLLVRIIDGNQNQFSSGFYTTPNIRFQVPFYDNFGDNYTVIASADNCFQAGFTPVAVSPAAIQNLDLMLLPKEGQFNFAAAAWSALGQNEPKVAGLLAHGAASPDEAERRYEQLLEQKPLSLACFLNLTTAMANIRLPAGKAPLDYLKELIWTDLPEQGLFAPAQDRFYAWADSALVSQVKAAAQQGEFAPEVNPNFFHPGATSSYKQIQFGEANVQLTFHEKNTRTIDGVSCAAVEPDIDYYKDLGAHALLEVLPNFVSGGLTDPKQAYVLRWIAGRHAGVADFDPPYTFTA